jgi:hypothetical protein
MTYSPVRHLISRGFFATFVLLTFAAQLASAAFDVETKLTASDAAAQDIFGFSTAISGNTVIVGAVHDGDAGFQSGSAYLFNVTTGNQLAKLTASDAAAEDDFGYSVGISGNTAIVGARFNDDGGFNSGSAYLFDVTTGNQLFKLTASDAEAIDEFGFSVGISGNTAIVGSYTADDVAPGTGSAYLFDVLTGNQLFKLNATDATAGASLGWSVAVSGNTAIVGAPGKNDAGFSTGAAYLFDVTTGNQLFKLNASDAASSNYFGISVAISGNIAIVGARLGSGTVNGSGSAYLFDVTTGNQLFELTATDPGGGDEFGYSVAISGNIAIVGAKYDNDAGNDSGSAYLFDVTTGNQLAKLTASDAAAADWFGYSVGISGDAVVVGAVLDDDTASNSGSAYLYSSIPEPASAMLLLLGCPALMQRRKLR